MKELKERAIPLNQIVEGNALEILRGFPDEWIDTVITSPPYWGLRTYGTTPQIWGGLPHCPHEWHSDLNFWHSDTRDTAQKEISDCGFQSTGPEASTCRKCNAWRGELGLEPYFFQYVEHLCSVFDEVKRVLKPTGTLWVNMGDTYGNGKGATPKSLCQIPNRFAIEMAQRGWILRNEIIWHKPNAMPSSVKDRFTVDFEKVFFFSKSGTYYFETQFEPMESNLHDIKRMSTGRKAYKGKWSGDSKQLNMPQSWDGRRIQSAFVAGGTLGRNKRTVWRISTRAFPEAHFAVFPQELVETPVKASCPEFVCTKCAKPREKIYESVDVGRVQSDTKYKTKIDNAGRLAEKRQAYRALGFENPPPPRLVSYTKCGCGARFEPGIVLDPFIGSGTTAVVALALNRRFIGIELNPDYAKMARRRISQLFPNESIDRKQGDMK